MKSTQKISLLGLIALLIFLAASCTDRFDDYSTSQADQPKFSADTIRFDTLFSRISSSTLRFKVFNPHSKTIQLSRVALMSAGQSGYRINVDGMSGNEFSGLSILPRDSMFVFLEATFPEGADDAPQEVTDSIQFVVNGISSYVLLSGYRQNVDELASLIVRSDTTLSSTRPIVLTDSIVVEAGATLNLAAGTRLLMRNNAHIMVKGRLRSMGTPQQRVRIESIRQDWLLPDLSYTLVPGQWGGLSFIEGSQGNELYYTTIKNGRWGISFDAGQSSSEEPLMLKMEGCVVHNIKGPGIYAKGGSIFIANSEISNTMGSTLALYGGYYRIEQSSICNFYKWGTRSGAAIDYRAAFINSGVGGGYTDAPASRLNVTNSIIDGSKNTSNFQNNETGGELLLGDANTSNPIPSAELLSKVSLSFNYMRCTKQILDNSSNCTLATNKEKPDSTYVLVGYDKELKKSNFMYDFHPLSKAIFVGQANPYITSKWPFDLNGEPRSSQTAGAYVVRQEE